MKKIYIIAAGMVLLAILLLTNAAADVSTYGSFQEARESGNIFKIAGQLSREREMAYDPQVDPNLFTFYMKDSKGEERKVLLRAAKPQDFERSEQVVATGSMQGEEFIATEVLLKCPSKYKSDEVYIKSNI
jgi:cytochrome c-type biogenesis protein CcmE